MMYVIDSSRVRARISSTAATQAHRVGTGTRRNAKSPGYATTPQFADGKAHTRHERQAVTRRVPAPIERERRSSAVAASSRVSYRTPHPITAAGSDGWVVIVIRGFVGGGAFSPIPLRVVGRGWMLGVVPRHSILPRNSGPPWTHRAPRARRTLLERDLRTARRRHCRLLPVRGKTARRRGHTN